MCRQPLPFSFRYYFKSEQRLTIRREVDRLSPPAACAPSSPARCPRITPPAPEPSSPTPSVTPPAAAAAAGSVGAKGVRCTVPAAAFWADLMAASAAATISPSVMAPTPPSRGVAATASKPESKPSLVVALASPSSIPPPPLRPLTLALAGAP